MIFLRDEELLEVKTHLKSQLPTITYHANSLKFLVSLYFAIVKMVLKLIFVACYILNIICLYIFICK